MEQIETRQVERSVVVDVICDCCGGSCVRGDDHHKQVERASFRADWGWDSKRDLEQWKADLCEQCAEAVKAFIDAGSGAGVQVKVV